MDYRRFPDTEEADGGGEINPSPDSTPQKGGGCSAVSAGAHLELPLYNGVNHSIDLSPVQIQTADRTEASCHQIQRKPLTPL